ncbi:polysialyltransferase family glycosyltransferase [Sulfurimonas marina]|uniref:Uncharacterized protein n=1 Tax=Sulfurimonas marina TaxID=2590551 RepID=A0A7M1ATT8_9BACT|nr:polysialyltransferase family glycosyltransferase [Sulfurimonas marina]QOP40829.1 hypothetical protein FJR03_03365 [Sulfurimonas marina]
MKKHSLSIVASPLQLLNAMEAVNSFSTNENILLLMYNSSLNKTDFQQKINLLNKEEWDKIIYYDLAKIRKKKRFFEQVKLIKELKKDKYDYLFVGDLGTIQQALMANLTTKNIYLIDDGTLTLSTYDVLKDKNFFHKFSFSKKLKLLRYLLANLKFRIKQDINFFTIYNLEPLPHISIKKHDFSHLKNAKLKLCEQSNDIYILGQKLVEVGFIEKEKYLEYLEKIIKRLLIEYTGNIIYIPHRAEIITDDYKELENERFSIKNDISEGPIEIFLLKNGIYPSVIVSFFSSALFNLKKIFHESTVLAVKIDRNDLKVQNDRLETINRSYSLLENAGVVIENFE